MCGLPITAADSGFFAAVVKGLSSVRDTGILHNRLGFLLTLNKYLIEAGRLGLQEQRFRAAPTEIQQTCQEQDHQ